MELGGRVRNQLDRDDVRVRVLDRAIQYVETVGLTLSISSVLVEQIASDAGVSMKQFSQVWATPDQFLSDLFCELAHQAHVDRADSESLLTTWQYLSMRINDLRSVEGRRSLMVDVIRTVAEYNFDVVTASSKWRTYAALSTTIMSWPDGPNRAKVLDALRASELAFVETIESFYRNIMLTIGYRLKAEYNGDYGPLVVAAASVIEGLGIVRSTVPALVEAHFERPTANGTEVWSVAATAFIGVVDAFIEPDPDYQPEEAIARLSTGIDVSPQSQDDAEY